MCLNNDTTIAFNRRGILASVERQYRKRLGDSSCAKNTPRYILQPVDDTEHLMTLVLQTVQVF